MAEREGNLAEAGREDKDKFPARQAVVSSTTSPTETEIRATMEMPLPRLRGEVGLCRLRGPRKCPESPAGLLWPHECALAMATLSTGHPSSLPSFFLFFPLWM